MREWHTDGSIEADTRYPAWIKWAFRQSWIPEWALSFLFQFAPGSR